MYEIETKDIRTNMDKFGLNKLATIEVILFLSCLLLVLCFIILPLALNEIARPELLIHNLVRPQILDLHEFVNLINDIPESSRPLYSRIAGLIGMAICLTLSLIMSFTAAFLKRRLGTVFYSRALSATKMLVLTYILEIAVLIIVLNLSSSESRALAISHISIYVLFALRIIAVATYLLNLFLTPGEDYDGVS